MHRNSPFKQDTDGVGLSDKWDVDLGYDPNLTDTDANGISDGGEDADNDGISNMWEAANGLKPDVNDSDLDPDSDGLTNLYEFKVGSYPFNSYSDSDTLMDGEEAMPLESTVAVARVPECSYFPIKILEWTEGSNYANKTKINSRGQVAFMIENTAHFWDIENGLRTIPVAGDNVTLIDLSESGRVLLMVSTNVATFPIVDYINDGIARVKTYIWSPSGEIKQLSTLTTDGLGEEIQEKSDELWLQLRIPRIQTLNLEIANMEEAVSDLDPATPNYEAIIEWYNDEISKRDKHISFLPQTFSQSEFKDAEIFNAPESNGDLGFSPLCFDENDHVYLRYSERVYYKGEHGLPFQFARRMNGWAKWDGENLIQPVFGEEEASRQIKIEFLHTYTEAGESTSDIDLNIVNSKGDILAQELTLNNGVLSSPHIALIDGQKSVLPARAWQGIIASKQLGINTSFVYGRNENDVRIIAQSPTWLPIAMTNAWTDYESPPMSNRLEFFMQETLWKNSLPEELTLDPNDWEYVWPHGISDNKGWIVADAWEQKEEGSSVSKRFLVALMPFEIISDLNNNGMIDGGDRTLKSEGAKPEATDEQKEKATEYIFANDNVSNGTWDKDDNTDSNKPSSAKDDDDAESISLTCAATWGAIWFEHSAIEKLSFYKTKECLTEDKIIFPFALSTEPSGKLPEKLYIRVDGDGFTAQAEGALVMKFGRPDKSETWAEDRIQFTAVNRVGDTKYFSAARDYMLEQNTRLHVRFFQSGKHQIRITAMRHESTDMGVIETFHRNPKIYGLPKVVAASQDYYDLILNGNYCYFEGGRVGQAWGMANHAMTSRCHGGCVVNGMESPATSVGGSHSFQQPHAEYLSASGQGTFGITTGVVPLNPSTQQAALGGFASNLGGGNYASHPWFGISEVGAEGAKNKLIFTVTQTAATTNYPIAELVQRLTDSGQIVCVAGDGGSSTGVAHRIEGSQVKIRYAGAKHSPDYYWINTYVGFKSQKPRP